jgi:hypothetical protein
LASSDTAFQNRIESVIAGKYSFACVNYSSGGSF